MENNNGLVVDARLTQATGTAEQETALAMVANLRIKHITVGAEKGYDAKEFANGLRGLSATPHVAQKARYSAIDGRTTRHEGYAASQKKRKRIEEIFGWMKTVGWLRKARYTGREKIGWLFMFFCCSLQYGSDEKLGDSCHRMIKDRGKKHVFPRIYP